MIPMTSEELFEITKLVGIRLYELGDISVTADDGRVATITKREVAALATGISSANVIVSLVPPKPVDELSIGDIGNVTQAVVGSYVALLNKFGMLFDGDGDGDD